MILHCRTTLLLTLTPVFLAMFAPPLHGQEPGRPNILFCLSDDQSYPHASAYGEPVIHTPVFDRIAREGVLFTQAYCAAPSCTPSRSAILTGQDIWRLAEGGQLFGTLAAKYPVYTELLAESGYHVGYIDKGWAPGSVQAGGRTTNPAGTKFKSFQEFFSKTPKGKPWCFWFGSRDPHRGYKKGSGVRAGMDPTKVKVPKIFPDTPEVRSDICDYFFEIQRFDQQIGEMVKLIEQAGQLDNTLIVITSDNGMPFPRAKANLYDLGTRMPMAVRWPKCTPGGRTIDDFVNLTDLAPTFLEAAGLAPPQAMTGRSLMNLLKSTKSGIVDSNRDAVATGRERHAWCRIDGMGYPARMIRTRDFLYIRNYEPDRWPAGDFRIVTNEGHYGDIDASPTKDVMIEQKDSNAHLFEVSFGKRPLEELYDCRKDPYQLHNLASDPTYKVTLQKLSARLTAHLKATGDPRETTGETRWDAWPYYGNNRWKILPEQKADSGLDSSPPTKDEAREPMAAIGPRAPTVKKMVVSNVRPKPRQAKKQLPHIDFADYFKDATMRVDYFHTANATCDEISVDQISVGGIWAGNPRNLLPPTENGRYAIKLIDVASGRLIYCRHYLDIVFEYKGTEAAKEGRKRTYHQTALIPCPKRDFQLAIECRARNHKLQSVFNRTIDPSDRSIKRESASSMDRSFAVLKNGHPHDCVDLVFVAEGYRSEEFGKFKQDVERFADYLFTLEPFAAMKKRFNIHGVFRPSAESGVDIPAERVYRNTAIDVSYDTFGSGAYPTVFDNKTMRDIAGKVPYDHVVVLVNTDKYGGSGFYNSYTLFTSDNKRSAEIFTHELGHGLAGLADEYVRESYFDVYYTRGVEPLEPNITAQTDPARVKWKRLLTPGVPLPTPAEDRYGDKVCLFAGAGYTRTGMYRCGLHCVMGAGGLPYCKACRSAIRDMIDYYSTPDFETNPTE